MADSETRYPSRRALRQAAQKAQRREKVLGTFRASGANNNPNRGIARRPGVHRRGQVFSRLAVLAALGVATIVVPLSGFVSPELSVASAGQTQVSESAGDSILNQLRRTAIEDEAEYLQAQPAAGTQARLREAAQVVEQGGCVATEPGANGDLSLFAEQEAELYWPMKQGSFRWTSPFGYRIHPVTGVSKLHEGVDMSAPLGTPIYAVADGKVISQADFSASMAVVISHEINGEKFYSAYLHMYADGIFVKVGQTVKKGQMIGEVGNAGLSTGPHLHFEIHPGGGGPVDPVPWMERHEAKYIGKTCK